MERLWILVLLLFSPGCTFLQPTPPPIAAPPPTGSFGEGASLSGLYYVTGTNPDGRPYRGTLSIQSQGEVYVLIWETGGTSIEGVGLLRGNILSAGWDCGVITYSVLEDGSLEGVWALCGESRVGTERAVPQKPGVQG